MGRPDPPAAAEKWGPVEVLGRLGAAGVLVPVEAVGRLVLLVRQVPVDYLAVQEVVGRREVRGKVDRREVLVPLVVQEAVGRPVPLVVPARRATPESLPAVQVPQVIREVRAAAGRPARPEAAGRPEAVGRLVVRDQAVCLEAAA